MSSDSRGRFRTVSLPLVLQGKGKVTFLRADVPARPGPPFAMVWYAKDGIEQSGALRLDLDKQVFLDPLADSGQEQIVADAAPTLARYLGEQIYSNVGEAAD